MIYDCLSVTNYYSVINYLLGCHNQSEIFFLIHDIQTRVSIGPKPTRPDPKSIHPETKILQNPNRKYSVLPVSGQVGFGRFSRFSARTDPSRNRNLGKPKLSTEPSMFDSVSRQSVSIGCTRFSELSRFCSALI